MKTEAPPDLQPSELSAKRKLAFIVVAVALLLGTIELAAFAVTPFANRFLLEPVLSRSEILEQQTRSLSRLLEDTGGALEIHPTRGWRYRPGFAGGGDTINMAGLRSTREYATAPVEGVPRIASFGDSFSYGTEVSNADGWAAMLESGWRAEALNYGVGGYGTDQAFIRYLEEGTEMSPETVLIGFAPVDLRRTVNRYRGFMSHYEGPYFKPRFVSKGGRLVVIPPPVATRADAERLIEDPASVVEAGELDTWYEPAIYEHRLYSWSASYRLLTGVWRRAKRRFVSPYRLFENGVFSTDTEAYALQLGILEAFVDSVKVDGMRPVVVIFPSRLDVSRVAAGDPPEYKPLKADLTGEGIELVDPIDALVESGLPLGELFMPGGHYAPPANRVMAVEIASFLHLASR